MFTDTIINKIPIPRGKIKPMEKVNIHSRLKINWISYMTLFLFLNRCAGMSQLTDHILQVECRNQSGLSTFTNTVLWTALPCFSSVSMNVFSSPLSALLSLYFRNGMKTNAPCNSSVRKPDLGQMVWAAGVGLRAVPAVLSISQSHEPHVGLSTWKVQMEMCCKGQVHSWFWTLSMEKECKISH